jgi:glycerol-3-phosphate acyltransferase PlsY
MPPDLLTLALLALVAYLLGSIPFGLVLTHLTGHGDVREIGSGNIGATNVLRTGDKKLAAAVLLLDAGKGAVAVLIARRWGADAAAVAAVAAMIGHLFPIWLGFKGGKGVATAAGVLLAYAWPVGLAGIATWLVIALVTRYSSLAALAAALLIPVYALPFLPFDSERIGVVVILSLLVILRHRGNIVRLLRGEEGRISLGKKTR